MEAAIKLFVEKGYDDTSVKNIIDEAGISKGGFYHHYESKEKLMEDIVQIFVENIMNTGKIVLEDEKLSAVEKFNNFMKLANSYKMQNVSQTSTIFTAIYLQKNNEHVEKLVFGRSAELLTPIIEKIIIQGIKENVFKTEFPEEVADVFVKLLLIHQKEMGLLFIEALKEQNMEKIEIIKRKFAFFEKMLEGLLGVKEETFNLKNIAFEAVDEAVEKLYDYFGKKDGGV
jgi:AcrR family transcriptional regulator